MYSAIISCPLLHGVFRARARRRNLGDLTLVGTNTMHIYQYLFASYPVRYDDSSTIREVFFIFYICLVSFQRQSLKIVNNVIPRIGLGRKHYR